MVGQSKQDQAEVIHTVGCTLTTIISMLKGIRYYPLLRASREHIPYRYGKMEMSNSYKRCYPLSRASGEHMPYLGQYCSDED